MKVVDLFSGIGGLGLGFEMAGSEIVCSLDNWSDAIETLNHNKGNHSGICLDIEKFNLKINEYINCDVDGVIGGPPCQGFSTAGISDISDEGIKINHKRNHLYLEFVNTVKILQPRFFLIENVRGLSTRLGGAFIDDIHKRFSKLGYKVNHALLNAADYGVPQLRHRVFIVGLKKRKFDFPQPSTNKYVTCYDALSDLPENPSASDKYLSNPKHEYQIKIRGKSSILRNHDITKHSKETIKIISMVPEGGSIKDLPEEFWAIRKFNKAFQRMSKDKPSLTIDTGHRNYFHYKYNRIPTVRESCRIQSFSDSFILLGSKTSQYKQIGNAVPPLLAKHIASNIIKQLD